MGRGPTIVPSCHPERSEGPEMRLWLLRSLRSLRMTIALVLLASGTALAQVGHPPESSPYRDIRKGHAVSATGGYFGGTGGDLDVGPHQGEVFGARYDIRSGSTIQMGLAVSRGNLERFIVDPFVELDERRTGPVSQSVTFAEFNLQFNVTGGKSWNRIAPFVGAGLGLAFAGDTPADTSRYEFGRKFYLAPSIGMRVFLSQRLHFRGEARAAFWKLNYPTTFQQEPVEEPGTPENPNAVIPGNNLTEWTASPWLQLGLGYSFSP
jgi:hypothetical protein